MLLPLVLLMVLALGYVTKAEGCRENAFHCAVDESMRASAMAIDGVSGRAAAFRIRRRIETDVPGLSGYSVRGFVYGISDGVCDEVSSYHLETTSDLALPAGFGHAFRSSAGIKYRCFVGKDYGGDPLGTEGLENNLPEDPVWIFPQSGQKYHTKACTYVNASVRAERLTSSLRREREPCAACRSEDLPSGSIVYCFSGEGTAYHRGSCRTIRRHTIVIDRTEAITKGYTPCSKCGGTSSEEQNLCGNRTTIHCAFSAIHFTDMSRPSSPPRALMASFR